MVKHILFVCTGNTCRSPLAEGLLRTMAEQAGLSLDIRSAGVAAVDGVPVSKHSGDILREKGFPESLSSRSLTAELVAWAELILTMTEGHRRLVVQQYPQAVEKVFTLKEYTLDDPALLEKLKERESFFAELRMKQALNQPISEAEWQRARELEQTAPDFDIADPFGGSRDDYERCAVEIEDCLRKLIEKIRK